MKECLQCKKEFEPIRESNTFCSAYCRVKWNRKNVKPKKAISDLQVQVLYNAVLDMVSKVNYTPTTISSYDAPKINNLGTDEIGQWQAPKTIEKSFQQFMNEITDLQFEEEFRNFAKSIENSSLSRKQKDLLLLNMRQSKL